MKIVSIVFFITITLSILVSFVFSVISVVRFYKTLAKSDESVRRSENRKTFLMFAVPLLSVFGLMLLQGALSLVLELLRIPTSY